MAQPIQTLQEKQFAVFHFQAPRRGDVKVRNATSQYRGRMVFIRNQVNPYFKFLPEAAENGAL